MDYQKVGLKCGLEIHQQLEGKKLFCSCPTLLRDDKAHFIVVRKLRASAGESGEVDIAAREEQLKDKLIVYEGYYDSTCLVELDAEPPHEINMGALYTCLQFCTLVKANVFSLVQVMRKTVVDGSNTSGFQRTALVGGKGKIITGMGEVGISNISLEEESAKNIAETAEERVFRLDRLGMPLIEVGTDPDIHTPEQAQEAAKKIGLLLRSLPGIKRGLGTIRQDVNVSVIGGNRIEIKGVQELRQVALFVELEVKRQLELLKIKEDLKDVKLNPFKIVDLTELLNNSSSKIITRTLQSQGKVLALKLDHFANYLGKELQPNYRLGTEFSGRAKAKAGVGGIFHSDELPNYGLTIQEVENIKKELKCGLQDGFILVADTEEKSQKALVAVYERAEELWKGVPKEVRKANADGTTSYMRPMPGAARMYPETDVPLIKPSLKNIILPETLEEKMKRYQENFGLSKDLAEFMAKSDKVDLFEELVKKHSTIKAAFIAETLTSTLVDIKRSYQQDPEKLTDEDFKDVFNYMEEGKIHKDIIIDVLLDLIRGNFNVKNYASLSTEKLHQELSAVMKENPSAPFAALMGLAMKRLNGKASGKVISEELKRLIEKR